MPNDNDYRTERDQDPLKMTDEQKILRIKHLLEAYERAIENFSAGCVAPKQDEYLAPKKLTF